MMMGNEFVFLVFYQSPPVIGDGNKTINEISNGFSENAISQPRLHIFGEMGDGTYYLAVRISAKL
jgi:hypothetical protein